MKSLSALGEFLKRHRQLGLTTTILSEMAGTTPPHMSKMKRDGIKTSKYAARLYLGIKAAHPDLRFDMVDLVLTKKEQEEIRKEWMQ
jgi:hypothetical protein